MCLCVPETQSNAVLWPGYEERNPPEAEQGPVRPCRASGGTHPCSNGSQTLPGTPAQQFMDKRSNMILLIMDSCQDALRCSLRRVGTSVIRANPAFWGCHYAARCLRVLRDNAFDPRSCRSAH